MDILFWSLFIVVPFFALLQLRVAGESVNEVSLVNVTAVALYIFSILGTLPLFYFLDDYRYNIGIQDKSLVLIVLFYSCVNLVFFLFGVLFIRKIVGLKTLKFSSSEIGPIANFHKYALSGIFFFCVLVLFNYLRQLEQIAIFAALEEGANAAKKARSNMGNSFSGNYHWYKLIMHEVGSLLTFICFALWLNRRKIITFLAFIVTFLYSAFIAVMATEKAPFAWLLVGLFMTYFLSKNNGIVPLKKLMPFALLVIALLVASYIYFMGSSDIASALWSVFSRAFSGSISPAYFYLEFFPEKQEYLLGKTFPNPGGLMPYNPYLYTVEVMNWKFPELAKSGVIGSAPTVYWGEAYANFGPLGIPVVAFCVGSFVAIVSYLLSKIEINPITIGLTIWFILFFKDLSVTGFSGYFYSVYVFSISSLVVIVLLLRGYLKLRMSSNVCE